jgi:drug/metabolite transporter (DMT)-like permease
MRNNAIKPVTTSQVIIAFAIVYIVWGSTYFFIQKAVACFPPFMLGAIRFLTAGIILFFFAAFNRETLFNFKVIRIAAFTGVLLLLIANGSVIWLEKTVPSSIVAIMLSSSPIWFALLDFKKWKENFSSPPVIIGLVFGFFGVILLFKEQFAGMLSDQSASINWGSIFLLVCSPIVWAAGSLYSKYAGTGGSATVNSAWQMLAAGFGFLPFMIVRNEFESFDIHSVTASAWFAVIYLIIMGSIAGFSAYIWLLRVRPAAQVSTYGYVNPLVAVLLGVFFANEHVSKIQFAGLAIILTSVLLINLNQYRKRKGS